MNTTPITGLRALPVDTEYIIVSGTALPLRGLSGHREGQCFYMFYGDKGRMIRTKRAHANAVAATYVAKASGGTGLDANDWK